MGFLVLMANATMQAQGVLSMLPVAVIFAAAMSGWWIAWGRTEAAASAHSPVHSRWLSDRQYLPGSWGHRRRRVILARPGKRRRGNGHGRTFLPVWPRSRFSRSVLGSVTLPQRWETPLLWLPLCW